MIVKWFLIVLVFEGAILDDHDVYFGDNEKEFREAKAEVTKRAAARKADVWAECFAVNHESPPPGKPNDKKSEVTS